VFSPRGGKTSEKETPWLAEKIKSQARSKKEKKKKREGTDGNGIDMGGQGLIPFQKDSLETKKKRLVPSKS